MRKRNAAQQGDASGDHVFNMSSHLNSPTFLLDSV
jgi:hypothetical protein